MQKEKLIDLVRIHQHLYDLTDKDHNDETLAIKTWQKISEELNQRARKCRDTWASLRDAYIKIAKSNGTSKRTFEFAEELSFLQPFVDQYSASKENHDTTEDEEGSDFEADDDSSAKGEGNITGEDAVSKTGKDKAEERRFLQLVNEHPCIYDPTNEYYYDRGHIKTFSWELIAEEMQTTSKKCQDMWFRLRSSYVRDLRKNKATRISTYKHGEQMKFLLPHVKIDKNILLNYKRKNAKRITSMTKDFFNAISKMVRNLPESEQADVENQLIQLIDVAEMEHRKTQKEKGITAHMDSEMKDLTLHGQTIQSDVSENTSFDDENKPELSQIFVVKEEMEDLSKSLNQIDESFILTDSVNDLQICKTEFSTPVMDAVSIKFENFENTKDIVMTNV